MRGRTGAQVTRTTDFSGMGALCWAIMRGTTDVNNRLVALRAMRLDARSGGFGYRAAENVVVVAEDGGDLDVAADGLDVAGYSLDGGDLAAFDLGDPALGHAHPFGDVGLGQAECLAPFG